MFIFKMIDSHNKCKNNRLSMIFLKYRSGCYSSLRVVNFLLVPALCSSSFKYIMLPIVKIKKSKEKLLEEC